MIKRFMILAVLAATALVIYAVPGMGYEDYSGNTGAQNCANPSCHGPFRADGATLHPLHVGDTQMTETCGLCHFGDGNSNFSGVLLAESGDDANHSCNGCHEQSGLVARHEGITGCGCHNSAPPADPENTIPPYYGRPDVSLENPCRIGRNNGGEDFNGDGLGLDNDGDGVFDANDPDCVGVSNQERSWGAEKSIYGTE